ncbi:hypothetical protein HGA88_06460 [Candidatus Roizmanbacteria bacterium]|nr:hypothetical protein [Candidatus Roizmanbacteria bacterium]
MDPELTIKREYTLPPAIAEQANIVKRGPDFLTHTQNGKEWEFKQEDDPLEYLHKLDRLFPGELQQPITNLLFHVKNLGELNHLMLFGETLGIADRKQGIYPPWDGYFSLTERFRDKIESNEKLGINDAQFYLKPAYRGLIHEDVQETSKKIKCVKDEWLMIKTAILQTASNYNGEEMITALQELNGRYRHRDLLEPFFSEPEIKLWSRLITFIDAYAHNFSDENKQELMQKVIEEMRFEPVYFSEIFSTEGEKKENNRDSNEITKYQRFSYEKHILDQQFEFLFAAIVNNNLYGSEQFELSTAVSFLIPTIASLFDKTYINLEEILSDTRDIDYMAEVGVLNSSNALGFQIFSKTQMFGVPYQIAHERLTAIVKLGYDPRIGNTRTEN